MPQTKLTNIIDTTAPPLNIRLFGRLCQEAGMRSGRTHIATKMQLNPFLEQTENYFTYMCD